MLKGNGYSWMKPWTNLIEDDQLQDASKWTVDAPAGNVTLNTNYGVTDAESECKGAWVILNATGTKTEIWSKVFPVNNNYMWAPSSRMKVLGAAPTTSPDNPRIVLQFFDTLPNMTSLALGYRGPADTFVSLSMAWFRPYPNLQPYGPWMRYGLVIGPNSYGTSSRIIWTKPSLQIRQA